MTSCQSESWPLPATDRERSSAYLHLAHKTPYVFTPWPPRAATHGNDGTYKTTCQLRIQWHLAISCAPGTISHAWVQLHDTCSKSTAASKQTSAASNQVCLSTEHTPQLQSMLRNSSDTCTHTLQSRTRQLDNNLPWPLQQAHAACTQQQRPCSRQVHSQQHAMLAVGQKC